MFTEDFYPTGHDTLLIIGQCELIEGHDRVVNWPNILSSEKCNMMSFNVSVYFTHHSCINFPVMGQEWDPR